MFKVGDKVRIIRDTCRHGESIGEVLEVARIVADLGTCSFEDDDKTLFFYSGGVNGDENGWGNYFLKEDVERLLTDPIKSLFNHFKGLGKPDDIKIINK